MSPLRMRARPAPASFIEPCLPSPATRPPRDGDWLHEIKHDGYRLMARRDGAGTRLLTRNGHDWSERYPSIARAVYELRCKSCLIDGEVAVPDASGLTVFDLLRHGPQVKPHAVLYAFDLLAIDGEDLRREPIEVRKAALAKLLKGGRKFWQSQTSSTFGKNKSKTNGSQVDENSSIQFTDHMEGPADLIFRHACKLGCEGIVSKRKGSRYRSGRSPDWIKIKNPRCPAAKRDDEEDWSK